MKTTLEKGVLVLNISNAATANSLTPSVLEGLEIGLAAAAGDNVRVVLLAAEGKNFCSGGDMRWLGHDDTETAHGYISRVTELLSLLRGFSKPVVAAVQGHAVGGGAELAWEADLIVLSSDAVFQLPDVKIGSTPASVYRLTRLIGLGPATKMVLLGARLTADEALARGLAVEVVDRSELLDRAMDLALQIAELSSMAVAFAKQALRLAQMADPMGDLKANLEAELACYDSPEMRNAVDRFLDRPIDH